MARPYQKGDDESLEYGIDWTEVLPTGIGIDTSVWTIPTGLTGANEAQSSTGTTIIISGGTIGETYQVTNVITTDELPPETLERTLRIKVVEHKYK